MPRARLASLRGTPTRRSPRAPGAARRAGPGVALTTPWAPLPAGVTVTRSRDPRHAAAALPPFPAYERPPTESGPAPATRERPAFWDTAGWRGVRIDLTPGTSLYGTGEQAGPLLRNGTRKVCWNTDAFGYGDKSPSLYQSHPWVLAVRPDGTAFGVICETTWRCVVDCGASDPRALVFECRGPSPAVTVIDGPTPQAVVAALSCLTGRMPMPPLWALGYQQCRWSYEPESRVREVAQGFRDRRIPCDVLWLDIDYMDRFRCFTFDGEKFPSPAGLNADLHAMGFRTVWMIDPGLAVDPEYAVYRQAHEAGYFVRSTRAEVGPTSVLSDDMAKKWGLSTEGARPTNGEYHGRVWPGPCAFPDFTRADVRRWWAGLYRAYMAMGIDGVWNDMNEPAVFDGPGKTMPEHNRHEADAELGGPGPHARYHNIYGMQMVRATREGIAAANPGKRPFVLTRSSFLGGHRDAATWTGDNTGNIDHLRWSIPMVVNLGLSGQPFSGPDIGGFCGDVDGPTFALWMGVGALLPFARGHKVKDGKPHEPWSFGPEVEASCRRSLVRRYRLLPYLYTVFEAAARTGLPVCRPAFFAGPADPRLRAVDNVFLIGEDLLVAAPAHAPGSADAAAVLPAGDWREIDITDEAVSPGRSPDPWQPRLYLRGGAVLPVGPAAQHTGELARGGPLTLVAAPDAAGNARGGVYEDAGEGHGYRDGDFARLELVVEGGNLRTPGSRFTLAVIP